MLIFSINFIGCKDSLDLLLEIDQQAYCFLPTGKIDLSIVFDKTVFLDSLLLKLLNNKGFPAEIKFGAPIYKDSLISVSPKYIGLFRHSYQANSNVLRPYLEQAVENAEIKKDYYLNAIIGDNFDFAIVDCKIYVSKILEKKSIGKMYQEKLLFNTKSSNDFNFYVPLSYFDFDPNNANADFYDSYRYLCDYQSCRH